MRATRYSCELAPCSPEFAPERGHHLAAHRFLAVGEGRELIEIISFRAAEGIVMALRALHALTEEDAHRVGQVVERHAAVARVISHRRAFRIPAVADEETRRRVNSSHGMLSAIALRTQCR
jgi:hypothetical protein